MVLLGAGFITANIYAFPSIGNVTGTRTESVIKDVGKAVVVSETNKKLANLSASCQCNLKTGAVTNCDYSRIKQTVDNVKTGLQAALNRTANFNVRSGAQGCSSEVQSNITGWWYWRTQTASSQGTAIKMWLD